MGCRCGSANQTTHADFLRSRVAEQCGLFSLVAIPVKGEHETFAIIELFATEDRAPDVDQLSALTIIGRQLGAVYKRRQNAKRLANYDQLTKLTTPRLARDRGQQAITHATRKGSSAAFLFIDLDDFKSVNDEFGHGVGDSLLCHISMLYENIARNVDTVARIGGDEFLIILSDLKDSSGAQRVAQKLVDKLALLTRIDGRKITIGASIGIAIFEAGDENNFDKLIKTADEAMYQAKQQGKSTVALA